MNNQRASVRRVTVTVFFNDGKDPNLEKESSIAASS